MEFFISFSCAYPDLNCHIPSLNDELIPCRIIANVASLASGTAIKFEIYPFALLTAVRMYCIDCLHFIGISRIN